MVEEEARYVYSASLQALQQHHSPQGYRWGDSPGCIHKVDEGKIKLEALAAEETRPLVEGWIWAECWREGGGIIFWWLVKASFWPNSMTFFPSGSHLSWLLCGIWPWGPLLSWNLPPTWASLTLHKNSWFPCSLLQLPQFSLFPWLSYFTDSRARNDLKDELVQPLLFYRRWRSNLCQIILREVEMDLTARSEDSLSLVIHYSTSIY